jgi:hypothetical protein
LELIEESDIGLATERQWLLRESGELVAIFTSIGKTAENNIRNTKSDSSNSQPADHNSRS